MDSAGAGLAAMAVVLGLSGLSHPQGSESGATSMRVKNERDLMDGLIAFTQQRLRPAGLSVNVQRAQMTLSGSDTPSGVYEVRALWNADEEVPSQPLRFELRPEIGGTAREAYLAVPLMLEVPVAARALRRGDAFSCDDVVLQPRTARTSTPGLLEQLCRPGAARVLLRDLSAGQTVRAADVGVAYDVMVGTRVVLTTMDGGVAVSVDATALSDARAGQRVNVRLAHPRRTLPARVTGTGTVQLLEAEQR